MSEYLDRAGGDQTGSRRIKVSLRTINNPAEREKYRKMQN